MADAVCSGIIKICCLCLVADFAAKTFPTEDGDAVEITGDGRDLETRTGVMNENKKYLEEVKERQMKRQLEKTAATPASDAATPALIR